MTEQRIANYTLNELAAPAGVSPRTLRFYLVEDLLPAPLSRDRGAHYDDAHLTRLQSLQYYQGLGMELVNIKRLFASHYATAALDRGETPPPLGFETSAAQPGQGRLPDTPVSPWRGIELAPGLELHVSGAHPLPIPPALGHIAATCRDLFGLPSETEHEPD